jgi:hypothetical protein
LIVLLLITVAGCGGGGGGATGAEQVVRGDGYSFSAPGGWGVTRTPQGVTVTPAPGDDTLVSTATFRLRRPFRAVVWPRAVGELDGIADRLARQLGGRVQSRRTLAIGIREYGLGYEREGVQLRQRIRFVFRGRREYELLCRWRDEDGEPPACGVMLESFRLA